MLSSTIRAVVCAASLTTLCIPAPVLSEWTGGIEGGTVLRDDGNATQLRFNLYNRVRPFTHHIYIDWIRSNNQDDSYKAAYVPRYWFTNALYAFSELQYRVDKPLLVDRQTQALLGVGYQFIATETARLWGEAGAGNQTTEITNIGELSEDFLTARSGYHQILAQLFKFELELEVIRGDDFSEQIAEAAIAVGFGTGSLKYGYRTRRFKSDGLETQTQSDSFVSFGYGF